MQGRGDLGGAPCFHYLACLQDPVSNTYIAYSLHCSSFLGLPFRILNIDLVKPKKGTTMETIGSCRSSFDC